MKYSFLVVRKGEEFIYAVMKKLDMIEGLLPVRNRKHGGGRRHLS